MVAIAGLRGTGDWATDERPKNFREFILWRNPNGQAPVTALTSKMRVERTDDPEFSWWEEEQGPIRVQLDATGASATSTAFGLVSGGLSLIVGDLLLVETASEAAAYSSVELVEVSSITSDTAIVVKRGAAGTTGAATGASTYLTKVGNFFGEGTNSPNVAQTNPTKKSNYTQIFKTAYELTGTAENTKTRTGDPLKNDKMRTSFKHSVAMEFMFLFGVPSEATGANNKPRRTTGGLSHFITTNRKVYTTAPTEDTFLDDTYKVFNFDTGSAGSERLVFAGNVFLNNLNKLARNSSSTRINFDGTVKTYGMELQRWVLPQGTLYVRTHPLLNLHTRYSASAFIIDPSSIIYRPMQNRDIKMKDNIQANDADTRKGQWWGEVGLEVRHEANMAYLGNFTL